MTYRLRCLVLLALCAVGLMPVAAQAQWSDTRPAPLYPYQLQPGQAYAVEVAPGRYVFHRPAASRDYPYVGYPAGWHHVTRRHAAKRYVVRRGGKRLVVHTTKIVRDEPVVIVHKRVVDDPPRVIVRRHYVEDAPRVVAAAPKRRGLHTRRTRRGLPRVIRAEAEITILGPDRMNIRLYRKRGAAGAAFGKQ
jgi:hypothetical protein